MIVGLHGFAQCGKDTLAAELVKNYGYTRIAFADILRESMYRLNPWVDTGGDMTRLATLVDTIGWDRAKVIYPEVRRILQVYGTECGRDIHGDNVWVDLALADVLESENYVITDVRFENEVVAIEQAGGVLVKIDRPGTGPVNSHSSDAGLPDEWFDMIVRNNSTLANWKKQAANIDYEVNRITNFSSVV